MKILAVVVVLSLFLLAGSACAGDSTYNWSGFYGGASIGYVNASQDWTLKTNQFWGATGDNQDFTFNQLDVGAHVGAQYQWKWLVCGGEVGIFKGPHDKQSEPSPRFPTEDKWRADIHTIVKVVAKVGVAYDRFLGYAKGGYAGGMVDTEAMSVLAPGVVMETGKWHHGWTIGGGVEYALTKHWIIGAEYSYVDLGSQAHKAYSPLFFNAKVDAALHQVLLRVSFKF